MPSNVILFTSLSAIRAYTFHHILIVIWHKPVGQSHYRNCLVFKAVGLAASGAGKVDVVEVVATFATAHAVFADARAVVNLVEQVMLSEKAQGTEDAGAVHVGQPLFGVGKRKSLGAMLHGSIYEDADSGGAYAVMLQYFFGVHYLCFSIIE